MAEGRLFPPILSMRVLRFIMLGDCWGQKHRFRPRCTGGGPERPPKRECLFGHDRRSRQTHSHASSSKTRAQIPLGRSKMLFRRDPDFDLFRSPTRLKPSKMAVFVAISPQRVCLRISHCQPVDPDLKPKASFAPKGWLRNVRLRTRVALPPMGTFWALKRAHMGTAAYVLAR